MATRSPVRRSPCSPFRRNAADSAFQAIRFIRAIIQSFKIDSRVQFVSLLPPAGFIVIAFVLPVVLLGNRCLVFVAGVTTFHIVWACGMNLLYGDTGHPGDRIPGRAAS